MWESLDEDAAETVRRHLVALRGGAMFLSPQDASLLDRWLTEGWTAAQIVHALERAADARRKRPQRTPFDLSAAKRHLGKRSKGALRARSGRPAAPRHPLDPLADALHAQAEQDGRGTELRALAEDLRQLPVDDLHLLESRALARMRDFLLQAWTTMSDWEREARMADARRVLAPYAELLSADALDASAEELARDQLRQAYPLLSAATLQQGLAAHRGDRP